MNMRTLRKDLPASVSVFLVALPLCLGIALASGAPLMSGLVAGMVGGLVVGLLSGSHTSVAGPAAGLVAIVLAAISDLGSFELFLTAVMLAGLMQIAMAVLRAGGVAHYFPSAVIRGLLAAIGIILILKQLPHAVGYDADAEGDFSFWQMDGENTFSELLNILTSLELGAVLIAAMSLAILLSWSKIPRLDKSPVPAPLAVVVLAVVVNQLFEMVAPGYFLEASHRVTLPDFDGLTGFFSSLSRPDFSALNDSKVYVVAATLAIVASLETLLNLEAADKLDRHRRVSPPNRELLAQGFGNFASGALGGLPVTSVVVRSSVNVYSGAESKYSAVLHGMWLGVAVISFPHLLGLIPLSALAAILIVTGFKLASPSVFRDIYGRGWGQFIPFIATVVAIVLSDLLIGILIGLGIGLLFIVRKLVATPFLARTPNRPETNRPERLRLAQQVTFLHRAGVIKTLESIPEGTDLVIDASQTDSIDPDILGILRAFRDVQAPERKIRLSLIGFQDRFGLEDQVQYVDVFTEDKRKALSPRRVLELLKEGNERFCSGLPLERDLRRQVELTAETQYPIAAVLGCSDSRAPLELLFDKGIGSLFSIRVAGNVLSDDVIASLEYATEVAGVKLVLVLGHTGCGAINAACDSVSVGGHIKGLIQRIEPALDRVTREKADLSTSSTEFRRAVCLANVENTMSQLPEVSPLLAKRAASGDIEIVGGLYDLEDGSVIFIDDASRGQAVDGESAA